MANSQPSESIEPGPELGTSLAQQGSAQPGLSLQAPQHPGLHQALQHPGMPSLQGLQQASLQGLQRPVQPYLGAPPGQAAELPQLQLHPPAGPRLPPRGPFSPQ